MGERKWSFYIVRTLISNRRELLIRSTFPFEDNERGGPTHDKQDE
jgi:hypothetical protein